MIEIPEANDDRTNVPCWKAVRDQDGNLVPPVVYCQCGAALGMYNHAIDVDGTVSPSVWHHEEHDKGCGWHWNIRLVGYNEKYQEITFKKKD